VGLPEQDHIAVVGVDLFVDLLVQGGVAEIDRAAFAEIALKEGVELIKEFFTKFREVFEGLVNIPFEFGEDPVLIVAGFDAHQVDEPGFPFDLRADKNISQGVEELSFVEMVLGHDLSSLIAVLRFYLKGFASA